jgi:hypothetical protein
MGEITELFTETKINLKTMIYVFFNHFHINNDMFVELLTSVALLQLTLRKEMLQKYFMPLHMF